MYVFSFIRRFCFMLFFNILQFRFINLLYVNILMSFTNLITLKYNLTFFYEFNRFALQNKYNIEENDELYNIFTLILRFIIVYFSMINVVFLFFRKLFVYFNNLFEIFFFFILWKKREYNTLSKALSTFKLKTNVILFFYFFHIV